MNSNARSVTPTVSAQITRTLGEKAASVGLHFVDAPVSGGQAGSVNGVLTVMCGGDQAAFERVRPVVMAFARACTLVGGPGCGQLAKMVNQICIAGLMQALSEGVNFGLAAGLDMKLVLEVIGKGAAQSWQMEHRGATMVDDRFDMSCAALVRSRDELAAAGPEHAKIFHCPEHKTLERMMTSWDPETMEALGAQRKAKSPDRIDALVFALAELGFHLGIARVSERSDAHLTLDS